MLPDNPKITFIVITEIGPNKSQYHQILCAEHVLTQSLIHLKWVFNLGRWERLRFFRLCKNAAYFPEKLYWWNIVRHAPLKIDSRRVIKMRVLRIYFFWKLDEILKNSYSALKVGWEKKKRFLFHRRMTACLIVINFSYIQYDTKFPAEA